MKLVITNCNFSTQINLYCTMSTYTASANNDLLRNCRDFNSRFSGQRRYRSPYFDAQTEVSQWPSFPWRSRGERRPGATPSIEYQYTERQWKRPPSSSSFPLAEQMKFNEPENVEKSALATALTKSVSGEPVEADTPGNVAISTSANITEPSFYQFDDFSDAEIEDSDGEDYEESYASKCPASRIIMRNNLQLRELRLVTNIHQLIQMAQKIDPQLQQKLQRNQTKSTLYLMPSAK